MPHTPADLAWAVANLPPRYRGRENGAVLWLDFLDAHPDAPGNKSRPSLQPPAPPPPPGKFPPPLVNVGGGIGAVWARVEEAWRGERTVSGWEPERRGWTLRKTAREEGVGSANFNEVALAGDRCLRRDSDFMGWIRDRYAAGEWSQGQPPPRLGLWSAEILGYDQVHLAFDVLNVLLCIQREEAEDVAAAARRRIAQAAALYAALADSRGRVLAPQTRAASSDDGGASDFLRVLLGRPARLSGKAWDFYYASRLAKWGSEVYGWKHFVSAEDRAELATGRPERLLSTIWSSPGRIEIRHYADGHAAWFPVGPECHNSPQPAVVSWAEQQWIANPHRELRPAQKKFYPGQLCRSGIEGRELVSRLAPNEQTPDGWERRLPMPVGDPVWSFTVAGTEW